MTEPTIPIPEYWTAEQADAVLDFLYALESAIFLAYERSLCDLGTRQASAPESCDDETNEDLIPF